jgi:hypothetical protein
MVGLITLVSGVSVWTVSAFETDAQTVGIEQATVTHALGTSGSNLIEMLDDGAHGDGEAGDGVYGAEIPPYPAGSLVQYTFSYRTTVFVQQDPTVPDVVIDFDLPLDRVVINEFMASNSAAFQDGQSEFDDWIELLNVSTETVDLSGMYLSDSDDDRKQWSFPEGTTLGPGEYLIVWADDDVADDASLHANFRLARSGETILLVDTDANGNELIDAVTYTEQITDISFGRYPDGAGALLSLSSATPGATNVPGSADFDGDGTVGFGDFLSFAAHFGKATGEEGFDARFDLDGDGTVGFSDFLRFAQDFG